MPEQFANPKEVQVKDETVPDETAAQKIDHVADKLAAKPAKTENKFDQKNSVLFTQ